MKRIPGLVLLLGLGWAGSASGAECSACAYPRMPGGCPQEQLDLTLGLRIAASSLHLAEALPEQATVSTLELDLTAVLGLADDTFLDLVLPVRLIDFARDAASDRQVGAGDPQVALRYRLLDGEGEDLTLDLRAGALLPLGRGGAGLDRYLFSQQVIQAVFGAQAQIPIGDDVVGLFVLARAPLYATRDDFSPGLRVTGGASWSRSFESWSMRAGLGLYHEAADRLAARAIGYTGHSDVFFRVGLGLFETSAVPTEIAISLPFNFAREGEGSYHSPALLTLTLEHGI